VHLGGGEGLAAAATAAAAAAVHRMAVAGRGLTRGSSRSSTRTACTYFARRSDQRGVPRAGPLPTRTSATTSTTEGRGGDTRRRAVADGAGVAFGERGGGGGAHGVDVVFVVGLPESAPWRGQRLRRAGIVRTTLYGEDASVQCAARTYTFGKHEHCSVYDFLHHGAPLNKAAQSTLPIHLIHTGTDSAETGSADAGSS